MSKFVTALSLLGLLACRSYAEDSGKQHTDAPGETGIADATCANFESDDLDERVQDKALNEISGLGFGRANADTLWVHNDSGDSARLFAIDLEGTRRATLNLSKARADDWEDIALVSAPTDGGGIIYIGDIGDNRSKRTSVTVYRLEEPSLDDVETGADLQTEAYEQFELVYEDGAHNAEALMVDPRTNQLLVLTKTEKGTTALYATESALDKKTVETLYLQTTVDLTGLNIKGFRMVTAADISADGAWMLVRTYNDAYIWPRPADGTYAEWLATTPCELPVEAERQGEAITFSADGTYYFTISEGVQPEIFRFRQISKKN